MDQKPRSSPAVAILAVFLAAAGAACGWSLYRRWDPWIETCHLSEPVYRALFSRDERFVATWGYGRSPAFADIAVWDARTGNRIQALSFLPENEAWVVAVSPDLTAAVFGHQEQAFLWFSSGDPVKKLGAGKFWHASFSPDGATLATFDRSSGSRLWNARSGELIRVVSPEPAGPGIFFPDGKSLLSYEPSGDGTAGSLKRRSFPDCDEEWSVPVAGIGTLSVSSEGRRILAFHPRMRAGIYSASDGAVQKDFPQFDILTGALAPDNDLLLCTDGACRDGNVSGVLDTRTGKLVYQSPRLACADCVVVSPSGGRLLVGHGRTDSGGATIYRRRRPEPFWGISRLPEFWGLVLIACSALALGYCRGAPRSRA